MATVPMRYCLTILLLIPVCACHAQTIADIEKRLKPMYDTGELIVDTTGFSTLPSFNYVCDKPNDNRWDFYNVLDLNHDGRKDLIYSGPCIPYYQTGIFLNDGMRLKPVYDYPGHVVSIDPMPGKTVVNIYKEAVGCEWFSEYFEVTIYDDSRVEENKIAFDVNILIRIENPKMIKAKGILRATPEIDNRSAKKMGRKACDGYVRRGNRITRIKKSTPVIQLSETGTWRQILYAENKKQYLIGWMKMD